MLKNARPAPPEQASDHTSPNDLQRIDGISINGFDRAFATAAASLRQALQEMPEIAELSRNIIIDVSKEGLNISLVDQDGRLMFPDGATQPHDRTRRVLEAIADHPRMPNRIAVTGHTAVPRPEPARRRKARGTSPRAAPSASARSWPSTACPTTASPPWPARPTRIRCSRTTPYLAANRRVTITLLNEAPPLPFDQALTFPPRSRKAERTSGWTLEREPIPPPAARAPSAA